MSFISYNFFSLFFTLEIKSYNKLINFIYNIIIFIEVTNRIIIFHYILILMITY